MSRGERMRHNLLRLKPRTIEAVRSALWLRTHGSALRARLADRFRLRDVRLAHVWHWHHGTRYALARKEDGREVFVKCCGPAGTIEREAAMLERARTRAPGAARHFPMIVDADSSGPYPTLVVERLEGRLLSDHLAHDSPPPPDVVIPQLEAIAAALAEAGVIHRDVRPPNLFIVPGSSSAPRVVLIDFAFAVLAEDPAPQEPAGVGEDPEILSYLGEDWRAGPYEWDDAHSLAVIARELAPAYDGELLERVGRLTYRAPAELVPSTGAGAGSK